MNTKIIGKFGIAVALLSVFMLTVPNASSAASYSLGNFLILVDDQLVLKGAANVNCCEGASIPARSDLGSRNSIVLGGTAATNVPVGAPALKDVAVIAPNVKLGSFAHVSQVIYDAATGSYVASGSGIIQPNPGNLYNDLGNNPLNDTGSKDLPAFPVFPIITVGASDVVVPQNGNVNISPGSYRDLIVGAYGTVNFTTTGIYQFRRIVASTATAYSLVMQADNIQINVNDFVSLGEFGNINPTGRPGLSFYVAGMDGTYGGANKNAKGVARDSGTFPAAFQYAGDGVWNACLVFVKNGTANIKGHTLFATQWFGNSLQEISNLSLDLQSPGQACFILVGCPTL
ncbi:MAG: hypothetical protein LLG06_11225 [Desulfobacteraceae bacterium]|nr:hypothetical protein [Desulfobacteraceae bacterium]